MKFNPSILFATLTPIVLASTPDVRAQSPLTLVTLYNFSALDSDSHNHEGSGPTSGVVQGSDGNFYGTASGGGASGVGTIFKLTPAGVPSVLHTFDGADGNEPYANLIRGRDGNFYGTTLFGGPDKDGSVFQITAAGVFTDLYSLNGTTGDLLYGGVIEGSDGSLYAAANEGSKHNFGNVFKLVPHGSLTTVTQTILYNFTGGTDGVSPLAGVIQGSDGNFYGTTRESLGSGGTVFKMTPAGALATLYTFGSTDDTGVNNDGNDPFASLVQGRDGNFYGTTYTGGTGGEGTVFKITPARVLTTLHSFSAAPDGTNSDGATPRTAMIQGSDGDFYGATSTGGANGAGTIFKITSTGVFTILHTFGVENGLHANSDGATPIGALFEDSDGNFYGTTVGGGTNGSGTVFELTGPPVITSVATAKAQTGQPFSYQITANRKPTGFATTGLPAGLTVNGKTGVISGTPQTATTVKFTISASNRYGKGSATLTLTVSAPALVITSAATATATVGKVFSYQITATNNPTSFGFQGTANGLAINGKTGVISGTPTAAGTFTYTVNAYNSVGKGSAMLTLTVSAGLPGITSATTASATTGKPFSYQTTATGDPTSFGFQGMANGLSIDVRSGMISGVPKASGTFTYTLNAYNATGKGSATLTVTVALGSPVITSATTATGKVGTEFSYQIAASGTPTSYGFAGNANGLTINPSTGLISGMPKAAGTFTYTLNAYNRVGKGSVTLTVTITN